MVPRLLPLPLLALPLLLIVFSITVTAKTSSYRHGFFVVIALLLFQTIRHTTSGIPAWDYPIGNALSILIFLASDFLICTNSITELRMNNQVASAEAFRSSGRLKWATTLVFSPRMIGWTCEPQHALPPRYSDEGGRKKFMVNQFKVLCLEVLLYDMLGLTTQLTSAFSAGGSRLVTYSWTRRSIHVLEIGASMFVSLDLAHRIWMLSLVATERWKPSDFRPLFGSVWHAQTLGGFWGLVISWT
ncbi:hypothetical protein ONZ45_g16119 [Pleurotus djamor]|nr:hypothetical protein ONZ45_g16119 [Pleurotus djamor]